MGTARTGSGIRLVLGGTVLGVMLLALSALAMRMTDQRPFCGSCHVMDVAAVTHKLSTHANLACNDCHAPTHLTARLPFKAAEGLRDFSANMSGAEPGIPVSLRTREVVNTNCKSCHAMTNMNVDSIEAKRFCVECHRNVAHMRAKPISTRMVAYE